MAQRPAGDTDPRFQLEPASAQAPWLLFALTVVLPLLLVLVLPEAGRDAARPLAQFAHGDPLLVKLYAAAVVLALLLGLFALLWTLMRRHRLSLDAGGFQLATSFYTRRIAWADVRLEGARVVSLGERPELRPLLKSNGFALPGFQSGWFRTRKLDRMLVARAGGDRVLWLPTRLGYDVLLQPRNPQATLQRMQELAAMAPPPAGR
jgi:hypothetical protein